MVRNIPKETTSESLKVQVEKQFNDEVKVAYVNLCYDITEMLALGSKIEEFSKDLAYYKLYLKKEMKTRHLSKKMFLDNTSLVPSPDVKRGLCKSETLDIKTLNTSLTDSFEEMSKYGKNLEPGKNDELFSGIAIVVVETQRMQELILRRGAIQNACCGAGSGANTGFRYERAPEPSDIYWENLAITNFQRNVRVTLTFIATFILVGACFGILYGISIANDKLQKQDDPNSGKVKFLSFLCSFVVIAINIMLLSVVRILSVKERHETHTGYNLSVAFKLALVRFINTAIVPTVVNAASDGWFTSGGLVSVYFSIMISMSVTTPITFFLDAGIIITALKRWYYKG